MRKFQATLSLSFFRQLLPFNADPLNGNAMVVRACGTQHKDGSLLRSKTYLLFGRGIATLVPWTASVPDEVYQMVFMEKCDKRGVMYWEVQCASGQQVSSSRLELHVSTTLPDPDDGYHIIPLISQEGALSQYFYLSCVA